MSEQVNNDEFVAETGYAEEGSSTQASFNTKVKAEWYVVHTYSGYENTVKAAIEMAVKNKGMHDLIQEVAVPVEKEVTITKSGKEKIIEHKTFPGYVLVKMVMDEDTWFLVRNTRGVTSFVGPGSDPVPLTAEEVASMGIIDITDDGVEYNVDDIVLITDGPFTGSVSAVKKVDMRKRTLVVTVTTFGRETPMELGFNQVQPYN